MTDLEFVIAVVSIAAGALVAIVGLSTITSLIKTWINRKKGSFDEEAFNRLGRAFMKHKKESERRIENLEAIITGDEPRSMTAPASNSAKVDAAKTIEIEDGEPKSKEVAKKQGNLRNMLRE